jgi:hypothetical protein
MEPPIRSIEREHCWLCHAAVIPIQSVESGWIRE